MDTTDRPLRGQSPNHSEEVERLTRDSNLRRLGLPLPDAEDVKDAGVTYPSGGDTPHACFGLYILRLIAADLVTKRRRRG